MKTMILNKTKLALTALALCTVCFVQAQLFNTGDASLDVTLKELNVSAKADLGSFKVDLAASFGTTEKKVTEMLVIMEPAEVYYAFQISKITARPVNDVIVSYKKNKGKGWGVIAKELGIKPGSAEFHKLKDASKNKAAKTKGNSKSKGNPGKSKGKSK